MQALSAHAHSEHSPSAPAQAADGSTAPTALRFVGATAAGDYLVCTAAQTGDSTAETATPRHFLLEVDERLRAALSQGTGRAAEWENPMTPQLRPKEIQNRIRAGASVEQVAAAAGCGVDRIEGFAYPVLLERATVAEKARATFPLRGAPLGSVAAANSGLTLEEIAVQTLSDRGQDHDLAWDAFKDERGWTVTLTWTVGRTENRAEWAYAAQPSGATITARNAEAADLLEPSRSPLRPVGNEPAEPQPAPVEAAPVTTAPAPVTAAQEATAAPAPAPRRGQRPPMPSWEDVLLGTRGGQAGQR